MSDGTETIIKAGDAYSIPPGHDGWVVGDEEAVMIEYSSVWDKDLNEKK